MECALLQPNNFASYFLSVAEGAEEERNIPQSLASKVMEKLWRISQKLFLPQGN
ncbi:MAG: hypothetical protein RML72_10575 [Bacteroidia bacterium]|nr:hypothetical protein [Bacteroidia bacterium]MDW8159303.1 hypothetical protein [Bacteroidia bacterium]